MHIDWDAEIDTPATIVVVGGGPSGVEAAIYARFLGYSVELLEAEKVGDSLLKWGSRSMGRPWQQLASSLGLAAIQAHEHPLPDPHEVPTHEQYVERYLLPLARTDLLYSSVTINAKVLSISRLGCRESDNVSRQRRAEQEFRVLAESSQRGQFTQIVDLVVDCTGADSVRSGLASGGGVPLGWKSVQHRIASGRRRVLTRERERFAGKRVMLCGDDLAAMVNAVELYELVQSSQTQLIWVQPKSLQEPSPTAAVPAEDEVLFEDDIQKAAEILRTADGLTVVPVRAWGIEAIREETGKLVVILQTTEDETLSFGVDELIHCGDCLNQPSFQTTFNMDAIEVESPVTCEPHFYRLGHRSGSHLPTNPFESLRTQIQQCFGLIGGRAELNLYQTVRPA